MLLRTVSGVVIKMTASCPVTATFGGGGMASQGLSKDSNDGRQKGQELPSGSELNPDPGTYLRGLKQTLYPV